MGSGWRPGRRVGLCLEASVIRWVVTPGWPGGEPLLGQIEWDPDRPQDAAAGLREALGSGGSVSAAVGMTLLRVKRLELPPLSAAEKRRLVRLDPERFFAVRGTRLVVSARGEDGLVFAVERERFRGWIEALESWRTIGRVEPAPYAMARALTRAGVTEGAVVEVGEAGSTVTRLGRGRVTDLRRLHGDPDRALDAVEEGVPVHLLHRSLEGESPGDVSEGDRVRALPAVDDVLPRFLPAYGAALGSDRDLDGALVEPDHGERLQRRRRTALAWAGGAVVAAALFAVAGLGDFRTGTLEALDEKVAALEDSAAAVATVREQLLGTVERNAFIDSLARNRGDGLTMLAELTRHLPEEAYVRRLVWTGDEWEIEGYAADAASVVPALERAAGIEDVRFLGATSRRTVGQEEYESFNLALRRAR